MSDVKAPALPEGDVWEVKEISYAGPKTMQIIWVRRKPGGGYFHVASVDVKPKQYRLGFQQCYEEGLKRLARDAERLDTEAAKIRDFAAARLMASGLEPQGAGTDE